MLSEKISVLRARPLSSPRKWGGGRFGEKCRFSKKKIEFGLPCYVKMFRAARGVYHLIILTNMTILKRATNACLQNCAWRRIQQKMANSILRNYFMHGYKLLNAVFTEMKTS